MKNINKLDFSPVMLNRNIDQALDKLISMITSIVGINTHKRIRHRYKLHKQARRNPDDTVTKLIYSRYRNFCNKLLKNIKRDYERSELYNNLKATWGTLKRITNLQVTSSPSEDLSNLSSTSKYSLNIINNHFVNARKQLT